MSSSPEERKFHYHYALSLPLGEIALIISGAKKKEHSCIGEWYLITKHQNEAAVLKHHVFGSPTASLEAICSDPPEKLIAEMGLDFAQTPLADWARTVLSKEEFRDHEFRRFGISEARYSLLVGLAYHFADIRDCLYVVSKKTLIPGLAQHVRKLADITIESHDHS